MFRSILYISQLIIFISNSPQTSCNCGCDEIRRSQFEVALENDISHYVCLKPQIANIIHDQMEKIEEGEYLVGTDNPIFQNYQESPLENVHVEEFYIDQYEVSNAHFADFIKNTDYVTDAEKFDDSFVFEGSLSESLRSKFHSDRVFNAPWWYKINNTFWREPEGKGSSIENKMDHPVVHVSWFDATEFCKWKNKRLPTEIEWEVACRGGKKNKLYPWGNKLNPGNQHW